MGSAGPVRPLTARGERAGGEATSDCAVAARMRFIVMAISRRKRSIMRVIAETAEGLLVESLVDALSSGGLVRRQALWLGRLLIAVILVAELRGTVSRADGQIHALAASVAVRELAIQVVGIGRIGVAEPIPAFPQPIDVGVMEIEDRVASDGGEFGHVAAEGEVREEVRVLIEPGIEPKVAGRRVDVELLVEGVQIDPVPVEGVDPFAAR